MAHTHDSDKKRAQMEDDRMHRLERRLRDEAPEAMTPAPPALRSRVLGEVWETTPAPAPVLARIGRPLLAAAAVLAVTAGAMVALSTLSGRPDDRAGSDGGASAMVTLLNEARSWGDRLPRLPEGVGMGMGAETERVLADAQRAARRFGERLVPVRNAFLGPRVESAERPAEAAPEQQPG